MKKMYIGFAALALLISVNLAMAETATQGVPFQALWDSVNRINTRITQEIANLQNQINHISLTPGPKGDKGDKGDTGEQGPKGEDGMLYHLYDANNQNLGLYIGSELYREITGTTHNPHGIEYYISLQPNSKVITQFSSYSDTREVKLDSEGPSLGIFFEGVDCGGAAFARPPIFVDPNEIVISSNGKYFRGTADAVTSRTALSWDIDGSCRNLNPSETSSGYRLQEIALSFTLPIAWPLRADK